MRARIIAALVGLAACAQPVRVPPVPATPDAEAGLVVIAAGLTPIASGYSAGLVIRNDGAKDAVGIAIDLTFLDAGGSPLGKAGERLPYCPAGKECLWGSSFTSDVVPATPAGIKAVAVAEAWDDASRSAPFVVASRRADGSIAGRAPPNGSVYVLSIVGGEPRAGVFRRTTVEEAFVVPGDLLPAVAGEAIRAVFYDEAMPQGE